MKKQLTLPWGVSAEKDRTSESVNNRPIIHLPPPKGKMKTINSVSGGRSSAYMAHHYPSDHYLFSLVRIDWKEGAIKDKKMIQFIEDRTHAPFVNTAEHNDTLYVIRDLEQMLGKKIEWVTGMTFDELIVWKKALPNIMGRWCTFYLKFLPQFIWIRDNINEVVRVNIGFRADELGRKIEMYYAKKSGKIKHPGLIDYPINPGDEGRKKWARWMYRCVSFPMCERGQGATFRHVWEWAETTDLKFPPVECGNCVGCHMKSLERIHRAAKIDPQKAGWWPHQEDVILGLTGKDRKFRKEIKYADLFRLSFSEQLPFDSEIMSCDMGGCTD